MPSRFVGVRARCSSSVTGMGFLPTNCMQLNHITVDTRNCPTAGMGAANIGRYS